MLESPQKHGSWLLALGQTLEAATQDSRKLPSGCAGFARARMGPKEVHVVPAGSGPG